MRLLLKQNAAFLRLKRCHAAKQQNDITGHLYYLTSSVQVHEQCLFLSLIRQHGHEKEKEKGSASCRQVKQV